MRTISKSFRSRFPLLLAAIVCVSAWGPGQADARRKRKRGKKPVAAKMNTEAMGQLMGEFKFGMSKDEVLKVLGKNVKARYADKIKATNDVYKQDKLRREEKKERKKIADSYTEFEGKKTGWDVSVIDEQFGHKSGESMLVFWEGDANGGSQRRFFFFYEGSLYKMFIALNTSNLPPAQQDFKLFHKAMNARYCEGKLVTETAYNGAIKPILVDWQSPKYHVQAVDKLGFYGSFCLVIANPTVEAQVVAARDANKSGKKRNAVIEAMLAGENDDVPSIDQNNNVIDSVVGK